MEVIDVTTCVVVVLRVSETRIYIHFKISALH